MDAFDDFLGPEPGGDSLPPSTPLAPAPPAPPAIASLEDDLFTSLQNTTAPAPAPAVITEPNGDDMMSFLMESSPAAVSVSMATSPPSPHQNSDPFFDDLLSTPQPSQQPVPGRDEDDDLFASLEGPSTRTGDPEKPSRVESPLEQDFLSWLDDTSATAPSSSATDTQPRGDPSSLGAMDDFFDEVFGEKSPDSAKNQSSNPPATPNTFSNLKRFDSMLRAEASSGFPDLSRIRDVIFGAGYLPQSCRGHVWSVLLVGGSVVEDQEAEFWRPSTRDENIENYAQLRSDCEAILKRVLDKENLSLKPTNPMQCKEDLHDILLLYCIRKKTPYRSLLCDLLSPLLFVSPPYSPPSRALSSSCFYSLSNHFIPLINLPVPSFHLP